MDGDGWERGHNPTSMLMCNENSENMSNSLAAEDGKSMSRKRRKSTILKSEKIQYTNSRIHRRSYYAFYNTIIKGMD